MSEPQRYQMSIGGEQVGTSYFEVVDPATESAFAEAPEASKSEIDAAFGAAEGAFDSWAADSESRRSALRRAAEILTANVDELASLLVREQGKPMADAVGEVHGAAAWINYFADVEVAESERIDPGGVTQVRIPLGVVAAITPWNFPLIQSAWKFAPALRAGNTVVLKPSPYTPLATLRAAELMQEAFPPGVLNVVSGGDAVGIAMTEHPAAAMVSFTGSTQAGKAVAAAVASDLKRVTLELGGNDPAIILDDIDVDAVAEDLFWSAFINNGQACGIVKQVFIPESIFSAVTDALVAVAEAVPVGPGTEAGVRLGPINNHAQFVRVKELLEAALSQGATVRTGGKTIGDRGYFLQPTILTDVPSDARIVVEEQFGPVLPLIPYTDIDDVVATVNASKYGLSGSVWSSDPDKALAIGRKLKVGTVYVNGHALNAGPHVPFGGARWSGIGVENGLAGLEEYTQRQIIYSNGAHV